MGSSLGPTLANAFFVYFDKNWLLNYLSSFQPQHHRWFVDDIFISFNSREHLEPSKFSKMVDALTCHLQFKIKNNIISFLEVQIIREETFTI